MLPYVAFNLCLLPSSLHTTATWKQKHQRKSTAALDPRFPLYLSTTTLQRDLANSSPFVARGSMLVVLVAHVTAQPLHVEVCGVARSALPEYQSGVPRFDMCGGFIYVYF